MQSYDFDPNSTITVILCGGEGSRLFPLTMERSKPAVPLAGKYRFIDIPISLSINSGLKRIFLLTQFLSSSLHRHVQQSYQFDNYSPHGFIEILAAQKTRLTSSWYQGTADAVRQNLIHFANCKHEHVLILSGDQLYRMNFRHFLAQHIASNAEVTVATVPVMRKEASHFGILQINEDQRIRRFVEKPKESAVLDTLRLDAPTLATLGKRADEELFLASMGIYVFKRQALKEALEDEVRQDFGKHLIPQMIEAKQKVHAYVYDGYWEDIGTMRSYYQAMLDLTERQPKFDFYDPSSPIYTQNLHAPASQLNDCTIRQSVISDGCVIDQAEIDHSLIGIYTFIEESVKIENSVVMGADFFENSKEREENIRLNRPHLGIGANTSISGAIIDKNARIGRNVVISSQGKTEDIDKPPLYYVRDGIVIIPKGAIIPDGTVI